MKKVITGIARFRQTAYPQDKALFEALATGQSPEVMLITCADSRIDPSLITQTKPGDLFICRNAGNIVPPHSDDTSGETASIEFAVSALKVSHIVVCGHSDCGAMKGAMNPEAVKSLPHVHNWLGHCSVAVDQVKARHGKVEKEHLPEVIQENVLLQLKHLETHPAVAARLAEGSVELHGWVYDIGEGSISSYDFSRGQFVPLEDCYAHLLAQS